MKLSKVIYCNLFFLFSSGIMSLGVTAQDYKKCGLNEKSQKLAKLIIEDKDQNRSQLKCNLLLSKIADKKAKEMAELGRVSHIGKHPANRRLVEKGYPLSKIYPTFLENNVEAIAGGISKPEIMWQEFKNSSGHRTHLLAEHEFYLLQNEIGVGFYVDNKTAHVQFWVVYVAHREEAKTYSGEIAKSKN